MENVTLSNGLVMPLEGFGVFQIPDSTECEQAVYEAIKAGNRLLDTAAVYMNEEATGKGIARAIADGLVTREELFVVTKLWPQDYAYEDAKKAIDVSLNKLGLDYVDSYLLHQPYGDIYGAWKVCEEAYKEGKLKSIGVANFNIGKLEEFCMMVDVKPMINQIEIHPFFAQADAIEHMKSHGCLPMAWGPLAEGKHGIFTHPVLTEIGAKYEKTAAQVALKWNAQRGVIIIPKSVHVERIEQNIDIWDFTLTDEDMAKVDALDLGHSEIIDHSNPEIVKFILGTKIHE